MVDSLFIFKTDNLKIITNTFESPIPPNTTTFLIVSVVKTTLMIEATTAREENALYLASHMAEEYNLLRLGETIWVAQTEMNTMLKREGLRVVNQG